ncbi:hypothetical protein [Allokutzneria albata]|uniref:hypothetical protein n=1 Tax=Allokutzneria albata TaxID=211114 RepID=UPI0012DBF2B3|nr:hypothetical protein [Allokutzneria albata]
MARSLAAEQRISLMGLLVLVTGFLPWWSVRWTYSEGTAHGQRTATVSAWQVSTIWTLALLLAAAAATAWAWWSWRSGCRPLLATVAAFACIVLAAVMLVAERGSPLSSLPGTRRFEWSMSFTDGPMPENHIAQSWMVRDQLLTYDDGHLTVGTAWGWWIGLAAVIAVSVLLALRLRVLSRVTGDM